MLGDRIEQAIAMVGITPERVEKWLGAPCGCDERKHKLNMLEIWARKTVQGAWKQSATYFEELMTNE